MAGNLKIVMILITYGLSGVQSQTPCTQLNYDQCIRDLALQDPAATFYIKYTIDRMRDLCSEYKIAKACIQQFEHNCNAQTRNELQSSHAYFEYICDDTFPVFEKIRDCLVRPELEGRAISCNSTFFKTIGTPATGSICGHTRAYIDCLSTEVKIICGQEAADWQLGLDKATLKPRLEPSGCSLASTPVCFVAFMANHSTDVFKGACEDISFPCNSLTLPQRVNPTGDCHRFYQCADKDIIHDCRCGPGTRFNATLGTCVDSFYTNCSCPHGRGLTRPETPLSSPPVPGAVSLPVVGGAVSAAAALIVLITVLSVYCCVKRKAQSDKVTAQTGSQDGSYLPGAAYHVYEEVVAQGDALTPVPVHSLHLVGTGSYLHPPQNVEPAGNLHPDDTGSYLHVAECDEYEEPIAEATGHVREGYIDVISADEFKHLQADKEYEKLNHYQQLQLDTRSNTTIQVEHQVG